MDPERFARVKRVLLEARELEGAARDAFVHGACAGDAALRQEVVSLLAQEEAAPDVLAPGRLVDQAGQVIARLEDTEIGRDVGPYRIVEVIGAGGMGVVYRARQRWPIERDVALKLIRTGMDSDGVVARFEAERQTLASLDHPHVARVLDAGTDARGRPYFVMELVRGEPITRFADAQRLTLAERVDLMLQVCGAVQHAHQRGVIHRDLKPSNLLVADDGSGPHVRVIDFGIARAVQEPGAPRMTLAGQVLGTPRYMSPEQAAGDGAPVDTRTDVYALGVVLYELLTGHPPLALPATASLDALSALATQEPARPGEVVRRTTEDADGSDPPRRVVPADVAHARRTSVGRLARALSGDLEPILALALRKDPAGRYASVERLAEDLVRYRQRRPVLARRQTFRYRAARFVRRHALPVALATAVTALAVAFVVTALVQSREMARERDRALEAEARATTQAETARRTAEFLVGLFEVADPTEAEGGEVTVRAVLDRGAARIREELRDDPLVRAALMDAIGRVYQSLGRWPEAEALLDDALRTRRAELGDDHLDTAQSVANLAFLLQDLDRLDEAEPLLEAALATRAARLPPTDERVTSSRFALAALRQRRGDLDGAERELRAVLEIERAALGADHPYVAMDQNNLASVHSEKDELDEAERLYRASLAINRANHGEDHPETATNHANLAGVLRRRGDPAAGLEEARKALDIRRRLYGASHPHVAISLDAVAVHLEGLGRLEEAEAHFRDAVATFRGLGAGGHPRLSHALLGLGRLLSRAGRHDEALVPLEEAVAIDREALPEGHTDTARALHELGMAHVRRGAPGQAEPLLRTALSIRRARLPSPHRDTLASMVGLGACLLALGRPDEATPLLREAYALGAEHLGPEHDTVVRAAQHLRSLGRDVAEVPFER